MGKIISHLQAYPFWRGFSQSMEIYPSFDDFDDIDSLTMDDSELLELDMNAVGDDIWHAFHDLEKEEKAIHG